MIVLLSARSFFFQSFQNQNGLSKILWLDFLLKIYDVDQKLKILWKETFLARQPNCSDLSIPSVLMNINDKITISVVHMGLIGKLPQASFQHGIEFSSLYPKIIVTLGNKFCNKLGAKRVKTLTIVIVSVLSLV